MINSAQRNLVILDIGSHKLEEIQTLFSPFERQFFIYILWLLKLILKLILKFDRKSLRSLKEQPRVASFFFFTRRKYNVSIISIEPNPGVILKHLKRLRQKINITYIPSAILGHDVEPNFELSKLYTFGDSLSHSLYRKNRTMDKTQNNVCVSLKLGVIWEQLIELGLVTSDSEVILRMNCEGAELGVIKECDDMNLNVKLLIGSIGDIQKIHGSSEMEEANRIMKKHGYSYFYFKGDDPSTWGDVITPWRLVTSNFKS